MGGANAFSIDSKAFTLGFDGVEWIHIILWSAGVVFVVLFGLALVACGGCWRC